jgi:hypothetical protein
MRLATLNFTRNWPWLKYFAPILAGALLAWLAYKSVWMWGPAWQHDYPSYHLPFIARDMNLSTWELWPSLLYIWEGYPPLAHFVQGLIISATGQVALANGIHTLAMLLFMATARFIDPKIPLAWLVIAFFSVPLFIMGYPTGGLDDLFCLAVLVQFMVLAAQLAGDERRSLDIVFIAATGIAINSKMNSWAIALFFAIIFAFLQLRRFRKSPTEVAITLGVLAFVIGAWPIRNWLVMGSPIWPFAVPGLTNAGESPSSYFNAVVMPKMFAHTPSPLRYLISFFELTRFVTPEPLRWSFSMWHGGPDSPHQMMGGLNGAYMAAAVGVLIYLIVRGHIPKKMAWILAAMTAIASILPQSYEMRYGMYVPLTILFLVLRYSTGALRNMFCGVILIALFCVYNYHGPSYVFRGNEQLIDGRPAIAEFWKSQAGKPDEGPATCIPDTEKSWSLADPLGIYFTGPKLNNYHVRACRSDCDLPWQQCGFEW